MRAFVDMQEQLTLDAICLPSEDLVAREIEGEMVIVPIVAGIGNADDELYTLNETGKAIWQALDGCKTLRQVTEDLAEKFSSPEGDIEKDVLGFTNEMVQRGFLIVK